MRVSVLLNKLAKCETEKQIKNFLKTEFVPVFNGFAKLAKLQACNPDCSHQKSGSSVSVEFNHVISGKYITCIKPEILDGEFMIYIVTNYMHDGLGLMSQDYELMPDKEVLLKGDPSDRLLTLVKNAIQHAIDQHASLIESVGVPRKLALSVAKKSW